MISFIVYGRNDQYGYNQHKRVAISLNCMAEVLDYPDDEILFTDCNTPNDFPTLPEAIHDLLTEKAKAKIRIFRIRPEQYEKHRRGTSLATLESYSRNVALRRSNPKNRWVLSTNTDMVFVPLNDRKSLGEVVENIPDGLYELPRFEIAESLWETLDRTKPQEIIERFFNWGSQYFLNEFYLTLPAVKFENHGDFQLVPRHQMFSIHGFDEDMVWGWSVDSNLCMRLHILNNNVTEHLVGKGNVLGYHCAHIRQPHKIHKANNATFNDPAKFFLNVTSPYLPQQADTWGAPDENIEEISLKKSRFFSFPFDLQKSIEGIPQEGNVVSVLFGDAPSRRRLPYNSAHVSSFLLSHLANLSLETKIGYVGANKHILKILETFTKHNGWKAPTLISAEAWEEVHTNEEPPFRATSLVKLVLKSDIVIVDSYMGHLKAEMTPDGILSYPLDDKSEHFMKFIDNLLLLAIKTEIDNMANATDPKKTYIFIGYDNVEEVVQKTISLCIPPISNRINYGQLAF